MFQVSNSEREITFSTYLVQYVAENECPNFWGLFAAKVIKSHIKIHLKSDVQKVSYMLILFS